MNRSNLQKRITATVAALMMLAYASGCANRLPRIDPSGQRILLWPDEPTPTIAPVAAGGAPTLAPGTTIAVPATPSNVTAPPVYTDPFLPGPGSTSTDWLGRPVVVGPPVATTAGQPVIAGAAPQQPKERVIVNPSRVIAPVGSEVILIAGVCQESGYLRTNERIEWLVDRAGTGQIVTVAARNQLDMLRLPQNTPRKVDNFFAIGATSPYPECLDRGTADPRDDVQIRKGDAWVTVTSPVEGTSYITAYAPNVSDWSGRTARATIYWIDAQWSFPSPVTLAPGESHTLTTRITRQSDGAPIEGWIVRYKVVGGNAGLGYEEGTTYQDATDSQGRLSVQITPTDNRPGTTNIEVEIIRPEQAGMASSPRVSLAKGATSITWADGGITGSPMPIAPGNPVPPLEPTPADQPVDSGFTTPTIPSLPNTPSAPPLGSSPQPSPPVGTADLRLDVRQLTPNPLRVGMDVQFLVTVINQGSAAATGVKIVDEFDVGLSTDIANPGEQIFSSDRPFEVPAGESYELAPFSFRIDRAGSLSHNVRVTADNALPASQRVTINVEAAAPPVAPSLEVKLIGPPVETVGKTATFRVNVRNTGTVAATNLEVYAEFNPELSPAFGSREFDKDYYVRTGKIRWDVPRLEAGQSLNLEIVCNCNAPTQSTGGMASVVADGLVQAVTDEKLDMEIRPPLGGTAPPPPTSGIAPPATTPGDGLAVLITEVAVPQVRQRSLITLTIKNETGRVQRGVGFKVLIPPEFNADSQGVRSSATMNANPFWGQGNLLLTFGPVAELPAGGTIRAQIPVQPQRAGQTKIYVQTYSTDVDSEDYVKDFNILP